MTDKETFAPDCAHQCSGNCRRVGCNCACGEWHGKYEPEETNLTPEVMKDVEKQIGGAVRRLGEANFRESDTKLNNAILAAYKAGEKAGLDKFVEWCEADAERAMIGWERELANMLRAAVKLLKEWRDEYAALKADTSEKDV